MGPRGRPSRKGLCIRRLLFECQVLCVKDIYVSDVDIEMSRDVESLRIDRHLEVDLSSRVPGRRRRTVDRIEEHARTHPLSTIPLLVKHYRDGHPKVRELMKASLSRLTQSEPGEQALIECMFSRNDHIANTAAELLEARNYNSHNFLAAYKQARNLVVQARKGEVFCQDIEELIVDSINTYKEGRFDQGMTYMLMARDLLEDRLEWHSHLKGYIKDVLRMAPDLSRSGVQIDSIQESIRHLASAIPDREYHDARALLDLRRQETRLWKQLWSLEEYVSKRIKTKPFSELAFLEEDDKRLIQSFMRTAGRVDETIQDGRPADALKTVSEFLGGEVSAEYLARNGKRLDANDEAAWFTMWSVTLGILKLVAPVIPNVAEEFYQQYFRDREESPSIHSVSWPEPFAELEPEDVPADGPGKG